MEITSHQKMAITAKNLFLPQIYWIMIRNCMSPEIKGMILQNKVRDWEASFIRALGDLHLLAIPAPPSSFWSPDLNDKLLAIIQADRPIESATALQDLINDTSSFKHLFHHAKSRNTVPPPAEAVGLLRWQGGEEIAQDKPTKFFFELLKDGYAAAQLMLARHLSLPKPTYEHLKATPLVLLHEYLNNANFEPLKFVKTGLDDHRAAVTNFCMHPLEPWFDLTPDDPLRLRIIDLIKSIRPLIPQSFSEEWREELPNIEILSALKNRFDLKEQLSDMGFDSPNKSRENAANLVFVGPPGTGKSRMAALVAGKIIASGAELSEQDFRALELTVVKSGNEGGLSPNIGWIQFHPSYSYEDFVEGLRPVKSALAGTVRYVVTPGPLKALAQLATCYFVREQDGFTTEEYFINVTAFLKKYPEGFHLELPAEYQIYGLENRGGEFQIQAEDGSWRKAVETKAGLKKLLLLENEGVALVEGYVDVRWIPNAVKGASTRFVLVIDELNRGNPARVFGEVLSLIESSKRLGVSDGAPVTLPYSKDKFILPPNLSVICTMNLADRSLSAIDQAFRRRFKFHYLKPNFTLISDPEIFKNLTGSEKIINPALNVTIAEYFKILNRALEKLSIHVDRHVGHSFAFQVTKELYSRGSTPKTEDLDLAFLKIWAEELHPLLRDIVGERQIEEFQEILRNLLKIEALELPKGVVDSLNDAVPGAPAA